MAEARRTLSRPVLEVEKFKVVFQPWKLKGTKDWWRSS